MIYIIFIAVTLFLVLFVFYQWQYFTMFHPVKYRQDKLDGRFTILSLKAKDQTDLEGAVYRPESFKATVFYCGGISQDSVGLIYKLSQCYPEYRILTFNYRGYGNSKGSLSEALILDDALHVSGLFEKHYGHFSLIGYSFGGCVASFVASRKNVDKLVLIGAFDSILHLAKIKYPFVPKFLIRYSFDTASYVKNVDCDTYLIYTADDDIVYLKSTLALRKQIKRLVKFKELRGYNHHQLLCCDETIDFVNKALR